MDKDNSDNESRGASRWSKLIFGIFVTIILGALGSGLWDILFKPGIGNIGRFITGISHNIDNLVFTTAALDPLPLSGLIIILILTCVPLIGIGLLIFFRIHTATAKYSHGSNNSASEE